MVVGAVVFDPANHRNPEWGFTYHLEDAKPLLSQGDDVAAVVVLALALENFGAAAHRRHCLALGIPAHHAKTPVRFQNGAQHHAIARLKDMERQDFLREQHHIRQGEEWQFPHGQWVTAATWGWKRWVKQRQQWRSMLLRILGRSSRQRAAWGLRWLDRSRLFSGSREPATALLTWIQAPASFRPRRSNAFQYKGRLQRSLPGCTRFLSP